mgnify:CR=1 FL=1
MQNRIDSSYASIKEAAWTKESKERPAFAKRQAGGTFVTYAQTNFDSLDERPFGAVDSLVLSWLSYYRLPERLLHEVPDIASWKGAPVGELLRAEYFEEMLGDSWDPDGGRDLLFALRQSALPWDAHRRVSHGV